MEPFDLRLWEKFCSAGGDPTEPAIVDQITIDSRRVFSNHCVFVALKGAAQDGHTFVHQAAEAGARYAIVKKDWPGWSDKIQILRVDDPLTALQEIAKAYRKNQKCRIIGITGSYGKTMVKDLLEAFLAKKKKVIASPESFNSQIGVPLSLLTITTDNEIAIVEAAISEIGEMHKLEEMISPDFGILTHIGNKHLTSLGNLETIASEMTKLYCKIPKEGWVFHAEDPMLQAHLPKIDAEKLAWNLKEDNLPHASYCVQDKTKYTIEFPDGNLFQGKIHFGFSYFIDLLNLSIKPAWKLGVSSHDICEVLSHEQMEPIRTEIWKSPEGPIFIIDSYSSDPQSIDIALKQLELSGKNREKIFLFGGMRGKKHPADYKRIGEMINQLQVRKLLLIGDNAYGPLTEALQKQIQVTLHTNYQEAYFHLKSIINSNDTILIKGEHKEPFEHITASFNDSICTNHCQINLSAIRSNIETLRKKSKNSTRIMAMVKAQAYGTDELQISSFLQNCGIDILGVSYVDEGVALRRAGVTQSLFSIQASPYEAAKVLKADLEIGVSDKESIEAFAREASEKGRKIKVHLHIDTGMSRLGCRPENALSLALLIESFPSLILEGVFTHFACADDPKEDMFTRNQIATFDKVIAEMQALNISIPWKHIANSSGLLRFDLPQYNMARIGLALYGLFPSEASKTVDLKLAISLTSKIVGINHCKAGDTISYGRKYQVIKDQKIAVVPIGYFDGLNRNYSGKGHAIVKGQKVPMIGNICMDFLMLDVTEVENISIGDNVLLFGEDEFGNYLPPEDLALLGNTVIHELIACMGPRIQRVFILEEKPSLNH